MENLPSKFPIIVADNCHYPTSRLMNAVINLPEGYVVLPGLDNLLSDPNETSQTRSPSV